jgi:fatty-acyl-CoA synthase
METLTQRFEKAATVGGDVTFISGDEHLTISWAELHEDAKRVAAALQARGIAPGDHVALLGPTTRELVTAMHAIWLAGATMVCLPLPMRLASIEEFVNQTRTRVAKADAKLLIVDPQLAEFVVDQPGDPDRVNLDQLTTEASALLASAWERPVDDPDALAIIQFTSGSTSEPKGVMLPHHVILANLDGACEVGTLDLDNDVFVSWLPLYHDMGLVGLLLLPMTSGARLVLGAPQDFTARPARWMQWIARYRGTVTAGPNFAWALATRGLNRADTALDLSSLRIALNGAEPIDPTSVRSLLEAGERHGMTPGSVFPAFGMAEVAIAGTFPQVGQGLRTDWVDLGVLEQQRYAEPAEAGADGSREFVILGRPVPGLEIRVVDTKTAEPLAEREVGELEIRGTSVTPGYYRNPEATAEMFRDGWMRTGDLSYMLDGELVLCGRIKDVIIVGGRNIFPEDVERAVATVDGIRPGNVIAIGVEGRRKQEAMVVVAETKGGVSDELIRHVREAARSVSGLPPTDVVLVPAGTLPKTSSGKLQRSLCRQRYLDGELELAQEA